MIRTLQRWTPHQRYFLRDGTQVEGCSGIAKFGENMDGLVTWANREGLAGRDHKKTRDTAAGSGTIAHAYAEAYLVGDELDLSALNEDGSPQWSKEEKTLGEKAFEKFKAWWESGKYTFLFSELQLTSEVHRFGGTLDILARDPDKLKCLIDLKATKSLRTNHVIQGAGYLTLEDENRPEEPVDRMCILRLPKDGTNVEPLWVDPETFPIYQKVFLANLAAHNARKELDKVDPIAKRWKWKKK